MSAGYSSTKRTQIQELQREIDKLALLVAEAKKQGERIQAAADALGDPIVSRLEMNSSHFRERRPGSTGKSKPRPQNLKFPPTRVSADIPRFFT